METHNIHQAKTHLSKLVDRAADGEKIVIAKSGKPMAMLVPYQKPIVDRKGGQWKGKVKIFEDFDELPEEITEVHPTKNG